MTYNMTDTTLKIGQLDLDMTQFEVPKKLLFYLLKLIIGITRLMARKSKLKKLRKSLVLPLMPIK